MIALKNVSKLGILVLLCLSLLGCSRTRTDKNTLLRVEFILNFAGPVDTALYKYFIVVDSSSNFVLPDVPPYDYFPTPGRTFDQDNTVIQSKANNITTFYDDFFDTWNDYFVIDNNRLDLYHGPFDSASDFATHSTYQPQLGFTPETLTINGNTITFSFFVQDLSFVPTTLFFNAFATRLEDNETGRLQDILLNDGPLSVRLLSNELIFTPTDPEENGGADTLDGVSPGLDFTSWQVRVF